MNLRFQIVWHYIPEKSSNYGVYEITHTLEFSIRLAN
jgi:hypothetical protein